MTGLKRVGRTRRSDPQTPSDAGRAVVEVVVIGVLVMIPVIYVLLAVLRVQATTFAVAQAARDAARILDTAPGAVTGHERALQAAMVTLTDQRVPTAGLTLTYARPGTDCSGGEMVPRLAPGSAIDVCVTAPLVLPALPTGLTAANTVTGVFTLHVGEFRETR